MKDIVFHREIKVLLNGLRSYGIQHCRDNALDILISDSSKMNEFMVQAHKGFFITQERAILLLKRILKEQKSLKFNMKQARRDRDKNKENDMNELLKKTKYQEMVVRKSMDSIAWQLLGYDLTIIRRFYHGQELIDITDSNLDSELDYIERFRKDNPEGFVLISDLTSFIQIGDVITVDPKQGLQVVELKDGTINFELFQIMNNVVKTNSPYYLKRELEKLDDKKKKQFYRDIKQIDRSIKFKKVVNEGEGLDILTGLPIKIGEEEIELETFADTVNELLNECTKKGYATSVVEDCVLIGVYETDKFPSNIFDVWVELLEINMPIMDMRQSMFDPLGYPIFLQPFKNEHILDIIQGKKIVKMTININKWMSTFENDGIKWRWLSEKETARINTKTNGKNVIYKFGKKGIEITDVNGQVQYICNGSFSRIFTGLNMPSSVKKLLTITADER